jgi:hypothetical protein
MTEQAPEFSPQQIAAELDADYQGPSFTESLLATPGYSDALELAERELDAREDNKEQGGQI